MASSHVGRILVFTCVLALSLSTPCHARAPRQLKQGRQLQTTACPSTPLELCDFYFDGYSTSLPLISLAGSPDTGVGPAIVDPKTDEYVQVGNSGDGISLTSGQSVGNQFYANGEAAQIHFRTFNQGTSQFENQCILLPLTGVRTGSTNLNPGDNNQATYPDSHRCVVFKTGSASGGETGGTPTAPAPLSPPTLSLPPAPSTTDTPTATPPSLAPSPESAPSVEIAPTPSTASSAFPAMFIFGDSTTDVGTNNFLANPKSRADFLPYGENFIPASGRFSDGKLVLDFVADAVDLPSAPPFLDPNVSFAYGVNFASAASGALDTTFCEQNTRCISLSLQVAQFASIRPGFTAEVLSKSLFTISTGGNDYFEYALNTTLQQEVEPTAYVQSVVTSIAGAVQALYQLGARKFMVIDAPAVGCVPASLAQGNVSESNPTCVAALNQLAGGHSLALDTALETLKQLPGLLVVKGSAYNFTIAGSLAPSVYGLSSSPTACCGGGPFNGVIPCGSPGSTTCDNPEDFFFWDSIHPTQAAYEQFSIGLLYGTEPALSPPLISPYGLLELAAI